MATLQATTVSGNFSCTDMTAGTLGSSVVLPSGSVLQVGGTNNDYNWGTVGHSIEFHLTWLDVTFTTKAAQSSFAEWGRWNADDTNSAAFGIGIGFRYAVQGAPTVVVCNAFEHEEYDVSPVDKYRYNHHMTHFSPGIAASTVVTFRCYGEFNNSNGSHTNQEQKGQSHTVMEIKA